MNGKRRILRVVVMVVVLTSLATAPAVVFGQAYIMTGKISAIDQSYKTVVIEVPLASKMFTVAGPLAADAKLIKDNQRVGLDDFKIGERVTVKWHSTPQGHIIDRLVLK
ncbi:MAG: hypothetical protein JSW26_05740 [Desulfobacterales bacterium]|nr:MAG: hypothetical protein JSW26_05740 [Desulfobacterales bacterium]